VVNSLVVAVLAAVLTSVVATLAGYGFALFKFRGSGTAFGLVLLTFMVPFQAVLTPLFLELHFLHLLNSLLGLAQFYTTFNLPVRAYVMRNSFLQAPRELVDAARVDGASVSATLVSVLRPLTLPGVATTCLYAFLFSWTEFLGALSFLTMRHRLCRAAALLRARAGIRGIEGLSPTGLPAERTCFPRRTSAQQEGCEPAGAFQLVPLVRYNKLI
jgi:multiple sugar transport system permease protein